MNDESLGAGTNYITVTPYGTELIDGASSVVISTNGGSADLLSTSTGWTVLSSPGSLAGSGPTAGPRYCFISALQTPKGTVGTWSSFQTNGGLYFNGYVSSDAAQNDTITFYDAWLDAGTWQLDLIGFSGTDAGQLTVALGATTVNFSGNQEQYAGSGAAVRTNFAAVTVTTPGLYSLRCLAPTKNASSSGYKARLSAAILTRTS